jgi:cytochrome c-type biogenesis protein CcmH
MLIFFIVATLLLAGALLFVLPPLLGKRLRSGEVSHGLTNLAIYRDQLRELDADLTNGTLDAAQYETAKREIERRVLEEVEDDETQITSAAGPQWTLAASIAVVIPIVAIAGYLLLGTPVALDASKQVAQQQAGAHDMSPQRLATMIDGLQVRLRANPDDVEGWMMLAKTAQAVGRYDESVRAFREIVRRVPPDAQLLADFADTLAMANGRTLEGEPQQLIEQAIKVDPTNIKALALGGTIAFQQKDYAKAAKLWRGVLDSVPPDAEFAQRMRDSIIEAESSRRR